MIVTVRSCVRRGKWLLRRWVLDPKLHAFGRMAAYFAGGFLLSAASLGNAPLPLAMGLICGSSSWGAVLSAAGGFIGYRLFWGTAGFQCTVWVAAALLLSLFFSLRSVPRQPLLVPALAAFITAASGVIFQTWFADTTPVSIYLARVGLAAGTTALAEKVLYQRNPVCDWLAWGLGVLALVQIAPISYINAGFIAAAALAVCSAFPAAALAGLALDLAQITPVPMTAVLCGSFLFRLFPAKRSLLSLAPAIAYLCVMSLSGNFDFLPVTSLLLGGLLGIFLPLPAKATHRRGETGAAQVRLELAAGVLTQTQQLLLEAPEVPVDEDALVSRAAERACGNCPCRRNCTDRRRVMQLPGLLLHKDLLSTQELPIVCRKSGRFLAELHRAQEQMRSIRADRLRQEEYREALVQQYRFLSHYLQDLSDGLSRRLDSVRPHFAPEVSVYGNRPEAENGDRSLSFAGTRCRYYVLLCDGMGTGIGAVQEGKAAATLLQRLLRAGFPAQHALASLNSLCALRDRAAAVTVDLAEIELDTGKATLYKWGAAPSYLLSALGAEKIGTAGPPPGLSVADCRSSADKLSLRRGETLVMLSDGIGESQALHCCTRMAGQPPGELAAALLRCGQQGGEDDATVILVRLSPDAAAP